SSPERTSLLRAVHGAVYPHKRPRDWVIPQRYIVADADDVDAADLLVADFGQVDRHRPLQNTRSVQGRRRKYDAALETRSGLAFDAQRLRPHVGRIERRARVFGVRTILERAPQRNFSPRIVGLSIDRGCFEA